VLKDLSNSNTVCITVFHLHNNISPKQLKARVLKGNIEVKMFKILKKVITEESRIITI